MKVRYRRVERNIHQLTSGSYEVAVFVTGAGRQVRYFGPRTSKAEMRAWIATTRESLKRATGRLDKTRAELMQGAQKGPHRDQQTPENLNKSKELTGVVVAPPTRRPPAEAGGTC